MQLRIVHNQVLKLDLSKILKESKKNAQQSFNIAFSVNYDSDDDSIFNIVFDLEVFNPNDFKLKCKYAVWFKTTEPIDETFKSSHFPIVNAPAIAFPFLRSLISTITLNAGFTPAFLPSVNFTEFKNK